MMKKVLFIAHRGGGTGIHENRIETIRRALKDSYVDAVEIDIRKTADDILVLHHDRGVYINGKRIWIDGVKFAQIKHLGIPTFEEIFKLFQKSDKILNIDLKDEDSITLLAGFLKNKQIRKKIFFDCFDLTVLMRLQEEIPDGEYNLSFNPKDSFDFQRRFIVRILTLLASIFFSQIIIYILKKRAQKIKLDGISIYYRFAKKRFVKDLKSFGFKVYVWGSDNESDLKKIMRADIDGIKTREIRFFRKLKNRK